MFMKQLVPGISYIVAAINNHKMWIFKERPVIRSSHGKNVDTEDSFH